MKNWIPALLGTLAFSLFLASDSQAGTCSVTNFQPTGTLNRAKLNGRFDQVEACINGNVGDTNFDSSDPLANSNLAAPKAYGVISARLRCATQAGAFATELPMNVTIVDWNLHCDDCDSSDSWQVDLQIGGVTEQTVSGLDDSPYIAGGAIAESVTAGTDIELDVTQTATSACQGLNVTLVYTANHTS